MFAQARLRFDLVILDALMPDLTGSKTLVALRQIDPHVKALLVTGFDTSDGPGDWREVGFLGRVQKPFRIDELTAAVAEALALSSGRA
jgi:DNA-binding NtrC family response regulator